MSKTFFQFALLFVLLILAQAVVLNHVCLYGVAVPLVFIYFIIRLPISLGINSLLTLGFILGLTVDIFSDTLGVNTLGCTILAALRTPILRLYFPREEELSIPIPSKLSLGVGVFYKYALSMSIAYCTIYFVLEALTFLNWHRLLAHIAGSSLLTFILIVGLDSLMTSKSAKRL